MSGSTLPAPTNFTKSMEKSCVICSTDGKYKCPTCLVFYCSVQCCKKHRETGCDVWVKNEEKTQVLSQSKARYTTADTVPVEKLLMLRNDDSLKFILSNPHLRELLVKINNSEEPEKIMQMAMQEPLFVEFADACLRVVEPPRSD